MNSDIRVVFAAGKNGEFGLNNGLPWGKPFIKDMEHFRRFTKGCVLVMGKETFQSLPTALNDLGRYCVVISRTDVAPVCAKDGSLATEYMVTNGIDLEVMLHTIQHSFNKPVCIIGGVSLVQQTVKLANSVLYTEVERTDGEPMNADCYIDFDKLKFKEPSIGVKIGERAKMQMIVVQDELNFTETEREYNYTTRSFRNVIAPCSSTWWL